MRSIAASLGDGCLLVGKLPARLVDFDVDALTAGRDLFNFCPMGGHPRALLGVLASACLQFPLHEVPPFLQP